MNTLLRKITILALLVSCLQSSVVGSGFDSTEGAKSFITNFVLSRLPDPTGDAVALISESPEIIKAGLRGWLRGKMTDAATLEDFESFDRYNAFYTCLNGNCDELQKLQGASSIRILEVEEPETVEIDSGVQIGWLYWEGNPKFPVMLSYKGYNSGSYQYTESDVSENEDGIKRFRLRPTCSGGEDRELLWEFTLTDANGFKSNTVTAGFRCIK